MQIREIQGDDVARVAFSGRSFLQESNWLGNLTLDDTQILTTLLHMVDDDEHIICGAFEGDELAGFTMWGLEKPWTKEYLGIEILFYILPEYRTGGYAKALLDFSLQLCKDKGARLLYSSSTAGFDDEGRTARAYNALLRRNGFKELPSSKFLVREL